MQNQKWQSISEVVGLGLEFSKDLDETLLGQNSLLGLSPQTGGARVGRI